MQKKPLLFARLLFPFCVGIWVLRVSEFAELNSVMLIITFIVFILLFIINYLYTSIKVYNHIVILATTLYMFLFLLGATWCSVYNEASDFDHFSRKPADFLKVYVANEPQQKSSVLRFIARVMCVYKGGKKENATGSMMVSIRSDLHRSLSIKYGDTFIIPARYTAVDPPFNSGEFDFRFWLSNHNIYHQAFISAKEIAATGEQKGLALIRFSLALRQRQTDLYRKLIKDDEAFAVAATLILGYRSDLNAETLAAYSKTGTIHALSVSGMHVGIIYLVLEWGLQWMNKKQVLKWVKVMLILTLIWGYALLTGYSASVLRSAIMLTFFILAKSLRKEAGSFHVLALSACCLLCYDPFLLWDAGFQLSYLAVTGLIGLQPRIERLFSFKWVWAQKLWGLVALSIAAQVLTTPFSVYYFHQFPIYFIFSNLFIILPVTLLMYSGIAILLFRLYWLAPAFEWLICLMNNGLGRIAALPYAVVDAIWLSKPQFILLFLSLICLLIGLQNQRKLLLWSSLILFLCLQLLITSDELSCARQNKIVLYTLKKNYAVAFVTGRSAVLVTDLRGEDKVFKFHIRPALDQMKVTTVSFVDWSQNYTGGGLTKLGHQLHFRNYKVLLADSSLAGKRIKGNPRFNAIWLHLSPGLQLSILRKDLQFDKIWIDGTNKGYAIQNYLQDTINFKQTAIVLIKNNSSLINLK